MESFEPGVLELSYTMKVLHFCFIPFNVNCTQKVGHLVYNFFILMPIHASIEFISLASLAHSFLKGINLRA